MHTIHTSRNSQLQKRKKFQESRNGQKVQVATFTTLSWSMYDQITIYLFCKIFMPFILFYD